MVVILLWRKGHSRQSLRGIYLQEQHRRTAYKEFPKTVDCGVLLYVLIMFRAYVAKKQSLSDTTVCYISHKHFLSLTLPENTLTRNNMWREQW